jgi:hypothetical protein
VIIHREYEQGSEAWLRARAEIPTASEFSNLVTSKGKLREGEMVKSYLAEKLAQKWLGGPLPGFSSWATEQGSIREGEAIPWFCFEHNVQIDLVAFCTSDDGRVGCSPDGLIGEYNGIEVKCPQPQTHVKYLLAGVIPDDYVLQVQGSLFVTGRPTWTFLSYCPKFPALVLFAKPDPEIQDTIAEALALFLTKFDAGWERLVEMNGGEPAPKPAAATERPRFSWEPQSEELGEIVP